MRKELAFVGAAGAAGLTWWLLSRSARHAQLQQALVQPTNFDLTTTAAAGQVIILATYRERGADSSVPIGLPPTAPNDDIALIVQQLSSCVLRADGVSAPTDCWLLRVYRGGNPDAIYRRNPDKPLSKWVRLYGTDYGDLNTVRPPCLQPFCTADVSRLRAGSSSCA